MRDIVRCEFRDSLEFVYPDSTVSRTPRTHAQLDVARGGTAAIHVLLNGSPTARLGLAVTEAGRPVRAARWFRLHDVPVEENTGPVIFTETRRSGRNRHVTRRAPFRVFDAMEPLGTSVHPVAPVTVLRLQVAVAADARPGPRRLLIRVGHAEPLAWDVRVRPAVMTPSGADSFPYTNWFDVPAMATRHGLPEWSGQHWATIHRYAGLMRHARQNMFWIPLHLVFRRVGGIPVLDRPRLRRYVRLFTDAGLHWIEGGHVANREGVLGATRFGMALGGPPASSPAGDRDLRAIGGQLMAEIDRNGWRRRWIQHVADEPQPALAADYRIIAGMTRKYMPGIPLLDAIEDPTLVGSVDIWCPKGNAYQKHRTAYEAIRAGGDRMWFYACCEPGGPWLNRLLDMELLRPALFGWAAARYGLDGFLHWGFNHYQKGQDPFRQSVIPTWMGGEYSLPAGDTHIVYPGSGGPWSSVRLEAQREGFEDLELLRRLEKRDATAARRVVQRALRSFDRYTTSTASFRAARRVLLDRNP